MFKRSIGAIVSLLLLSFNVQAEDLPTFELIFNDGKVNKLRLEVPAQKRFKIVIHNQGKTPIEFESLPLRKEKVLGPKASSFVVINPLTPGEYAFYDEFHMATTKGVIVAK